MANFTEKQIQGMLDDLGDEYQSGLNKSEFCWFNRDGDQSFLDDGKELFAEGVIGEFARGTPFKNVIAAKRAAREAKRLLAFDGHSHAKISFWRLLGNKLIETKFTKDHKIKK